MLPAILYFATAAAVLALLHRFVTPLSRGAAIALVLTPLCFTGRALLTGQVYAPVEIPYMTLPLWSEKADLGVGEPYDPLLSDIALQMTPWREALRRSFAAGEWGLWNRFEMSGDVLAGAAQAAPFSPFTLIALLAPAALSFSFTASIAFLLAAAGGFLLAREMGGGERAGILAAAVFALSAPIAFQILWPLGFCWTLLPLVLTAVRRLVQRPAFGPVVFLASALSIVALSGHPETLLHIGALGAAWGVFELLQEGVPRRRALAAAIAAGSLAAALAAVQLLPFLEAVPQTAERIVRVELYAKSPLRVSPGTPSATLVSSALPFSRPRFSRFLLQHAEAGSIALALAICALLRVRLRGKWFLLGLLVVSVLAGAQAWPVAQWLHRLPLFDVALNERLASAVPLFVAMLAAAAFDRLERRDALVMAGVLALLSGCAWALRDGPIDRRRLVADTAPLAGAALITAAAPAASWAAPAIAGLVLVQRTLSDGALIPIHRPEVAYPHIALFDRLKRIDGPFRVVATGGSLIPNTAAMYGLEDPRGWTAMTLVEYAEMYPLWSVRRIFPQVDDLSRPALSMMNVRFAIAQRDEAVPDGWREVARDRDCKLLENERVLDRAFVPRTVRLGVPRGADIEEMKSAPEFADVAWIESGGEPRTEPNIGAVTSLRLARLGFEIGTSMNADGWLVVTEAAWKGWRATVDGRPVHVRRANHAFLAIPVPQGQHRVRVRYLPASFVAGAALSIGALAAMAAAAFIRGRRERGAALKLG